MTEDDGEFKPNESTISNLTSLFDSNMPHPSENHSLTYVAPKAPKAGESGGALKQFGSKSSQNQKLRIITSKSVQAYKLDNGNYVNQGTAGIAIVGNHELHIYQIIIYKNNKEHLCKTNITPNFSLTVMENNYASFYDNYGQNWSILFSSSTNVYEFAKQVAIAKYNSQMKKDKIIVQDLSPISGAKSKGGDVVNVAFSCSLLENDNVIPWRNKEHVTVEISDVHIFPWHEGVRDWSKNSKRIAIIPYELSAPWRNDVKKESCVVMEMEIVSITSPDGEKLGKKKEKDKQKPKERDVLKDKSVEEEHWMGKGGSSEDRTSDSCSHKTDIISRMAKIGQACPVSDAILSGARDSEEECSSMPRRGLKLSSVKKAVQELHRSLPIHLGQCSVKADSSQVDHSPKNMERNDDFCRPGKQCETRSGGNAVCEQVEPCQNVKDKEYERSACFEIKCAEEGVKISIDELSEKVDEVLCKLQNLDRGKWKGIKEGESEDTKVLEGVLTSLRGVIAENEYLKSEMQHQRHAIDEQNKKLENLMNLTLRCVEKSSFTERRGMVVEEENLGKWKAEKSKGSVVRKESGSDGKRYLERDSSEDRRTKYGGDVGEGSEGKETRVHDLEERKLDRRDTEEKGSEPWSGGEEKKSLNEKSEEVGEASSESKGVRNISLEDSFEDIKRVMNAVNKKLQSYFESDVNYLGSEIKEIIASTIKDVTMEYLGYKSKQRESAATDLYARDGSRRKFEGERERNSETRLREAVSRSAVKVTSNSRSYTVGENSENVTKVNSFQSGTKARKEVAESRMKLEESDSLAGDAERNRSAIYRGTSGVSGLSNIVDMSGEEGEEGRESDSERRTHLRGRRSCLSDEGVELRESYAEAMRSGTESSETLGGTVGDGTDKSVMGTPSRRSESRGVAFSDDLRISEQEVLVKSKSLVEYGDDEKVESEKCEITGEKIVANMEKSEISPPPCGRRKSELDGITRADSSRSRGIFKEDEVDVESFDIVESLKSSVSEPFSFRTSKKESSVDEEWEVSGSVTESAVKSKSEIVGTGGENENERCVKNGKGEVSGERREGPSEMPSLRSVLRIRSEGSRRVSSRTPGIPNEKEEIDNEEIERSDGKSTGRVSEEKKSVLVEPMSKTSFWTAKDVSSSITDTKIVDSVDVPGNVVEKEREKEESRGSWRSEPEEEFNVEEDSYYSRTKKGDSSFESTIVNYRSETEGETSVRSTVSRLSKSVKGESIAGIRMTKTENEVESNGESLRENKSESSEVVESRPFSSKSVVTWDENVAIAESRGEEEMKNWSEKIDERDEEWEDDEVTDASEWEEKERRKISTEECSKEEENEKEEMEKENSDEKESANGEENVKSSGSNSVSEKCYKILPDYYESWTFTKPPPLPLDDDDDDEDGEEWL